MTLTPRLILIAGAIAATALPMLAQGGFDGPGAYEIRNLKSNQVLDIDPRDRETVVQFPPRGTPTQVWIVSPAAPGYFYIRNASTQNAMETPRDANSAAVVAQRRDQDPNQQWRIEAGKDGNALLIARFGKAMDVPDGAGRDGLRMQIYDRNGDSNQRFVFRRVEGLIGGGDFRDGRDRDRDRGRGRDGRDRADRNGRYYDERDRMWKLTGDGACFYRESGFRGDAICARAGEDLADVFRESPGAFRSVKLFGRAREVTIFERPAFRGAMFRITRDESNLERVRSSWTNNVGDRMGSFQVN